MGYRQALQHGGQRDMENNALTEPTVASRRTLLIPIVK